MYKNAVLQSNADLARDGAFTCPSAVLTSRSCILVQSGALGYWQPAGLLTNTGRLMPSTTVRGTAPTAQVPCPARAACTSLEVVETAAASSALGQLAEVTDGTTACTSSVRRIGLQIDADADHKRSLPCRFTLDRRFRRVPHWHRPFISIVRI